MTQGQLAKKLGTTQSAISRIESAEYGKVNVSTLLALAAEFDLPLFIDMPEWRDWFVRMRDLSKKSFTRQAFDVKKIVGQSESQDSSGKASAEWAATIISWARLKTANTLGGHSNAALLWPSYLMTRQAESSDSGRRWPEVESFHYEEERVGNA